MSLYSAIQPLLFLLDAEKSHHLSLKTIRLLEKIGLSRLIVDANLHKIMASAPKVNSMGLKFDNPVGLAAGLDKNAEYIDALAHFGFGFIEVGTITPKAQAGNPMPRLFRIPEKQAIINRMGFNNIGIDGMIENIKKSKWVRDGGVLGINIGKNASTDIDKANDDYLYCLEKSYPYASYITVNISSPNTKNLRSLQSGQALEALLASIKNKQAELHKKYNTYKPVVLKIAPDLDDAGIEEIATLVLRYQFDGLIATNTTLDKSQLPAKWQQEAGGASGAILSKHATQVLQQFSNLLNGQIPIIGVGGISSHDDAQAKFKAGASLIQVYSGLIYKGPALVAEILKGLS
jgi:dihydroorotate dehydrogenase